MPNVYLGFPEREGCVADRTRTTTDLGGDLSGSDGQLTTSDNDGKRMVPYDDSSSVAAEWEKARGSAERPED